MAGASIGSTFFSSTTSDYGFPPPTSGYTNSNTSFGLNLTPSLGWFISDHSAIGAQFNLGYSHQKNFDKDAASGNTTNKNTYNSFTLGIGGFARNYFNASGSVLPYGQFNLNLGIGSSSNKGFAFITNSNPVYKNTYDGKSSGDFFANAGLAGGLTKKLNDHTGLDFNLGYTFSYYKNTTKTVSKIDLNNDGSIDETRTSEPTRKVTSHGVTFSIAFQVFLDPRK